MNLTHLGTEIRRFGHGKLPPLAFVVIILLPLLFGGLFVWSYWDPISKVNQLPVAFVNSDKGADADGEHLDAGQQITDRLAESDQINLDVVDAETARDGVRSGEYYFAMELPEDFSESVLSVRGDNPRRASLNATFNNDNGQIAQTLGNQVVSTVLGTINEELGTRVTDNLLVGFNTIGDGVDQAADGANELSDGAGSAADASKKLDSGAGELHEGIVSADEGAKKLESGAQELDEGLGTASNAADQLAGGLGQLNSATQRLGEGASQVSGGVDQIAGMVGQAADAQAQLLAGLVNVSSQLRATGVPPAQDLANQLDGVIEQVRTQALGPDSPVLGDVEKLSGGAQEIARQLTDPASEYSQGMQRATDGSQQLATGLHKLNDGSSQLVVGTQTLSQGTSKLVDGSQQLSVGAKQLSDGLVQLDEGSGTLALKLTEAGGKVPHYGDDQRADYAGAMSSPVEKNQQGDGLAIFGEGLAPIFISLGLFMGATVTFMVLHPLQRRAIESGMSPLRVVLASYLPAAIVGIGQATVMFLVQKLALGLNATHEVGMWLAMCLTAVTFQAIALGINALLGATVGRVICICLMALQIVSSGGLYPPETQPAFLQWFHHYDPMTYSTNLLRQMIFHYDAADPRLQQAIGALAAILVIFMAIAVVGAWRGRHIAMKDLHPEVAV